MMRLLIISVCIAAICGELAPLHKVSDRVPGSYLVKVKNTVSLDSFVASFGVIGEGRVFHRYVNIVHGAAVQIPDYLADALRNLDSVEYVEENGIAYTQQVASWGIDRVDQRNLPLDNKYNAPGSHGNVETTDLYNNWIGLLNIPYPSDTTINAGNHVASPEVCGPDYKTCSKSGSGSGTTIYVIDSGLLHTHNDYGGRASNLWDFDPDNGGVDCDGHGTHCGGTAAGSTFGIARGATLKSVRALGCTGSGQWADVIQGLDMVVKDTSTSNKVASMSIGGGASIFVDVAVANAVAMGVVVSVAAGNSNANACNYSPSREPTAITVGATDSDDDKASYSNYGSCLDLFAPGTYIVSTYIGSNTATATLSGTSMACPHVSGAVALLLQSGVSAADVPDTLVREATNGVVRNPGNYSPNLLLYVN